MKKARFSKKRIKFGYLALLVVLMAVGIFSYLGYRSEAVEGLYLTCDGFEMSAQNAYQMKMCIRDSHITAWQKENLR